MNILKPEKKEMHEKVSPPDREEHFDENEATKLSNGFKRQVPFEEKVPSERMRNKRDPADYRNRKLEQQFWSVSSYFPGVHDKERASSECVLHNGICEVLLQLSLHRCRPFHVSVTSPRGPNFETSCNG